MLTSEILLILIVFNSSSYFSTTTYAKSIDLIGVILTGFLMFWIWANSRIFGFNKVELGLCSKPVSHRLWKTIFCFVLVFYLVVFAVEILFPSEIKGDITFTRFFSTGIFTLIYGPVFEELLFRGYLFIRSQNFFQKRSLKFLIFQISPASIFSGVAFGFWHFPTPIILWFFNDSIIEIYSNLVGFVLFASIIGIFLGEIRRKTRSLLPGMVLHLVANSAYMLSIIMKVL